MSSNERDDDLIVDFSDGPNPIGTTLLRQADGYVRERFGLGNRPARHRGETDPGGWRAPSGLARQRSTREILAGLVGPTPTGAIDFAAVSARSTAGARSVQVDLGRRA